MVHRVVGPAMASTKNNGCGDVVSAGLGRLDRHSMGFCNDRVGKVCAFDHCR